MHYLSRSRIYRTLGAPLLALALACAPAASAWAAGALIDGSQGASAEASALGESAQGEHADQLDAELTDAAEEADGASDAVSDAASYLKAGGADSDNASGSPDLSSEGYAYRQYLSDRTPTGHSVGYDRLKNNVNFSGGKLSLLVDGKETPFDKGMLAHAPSTLFYTDVQDWGYERFTALVGIDAAQRASNQASVEFKVYGDDVLLWKSGEMTASSSAKAVDVDISKVHVLKLEVDDLGSNAQDHAVWADASFWKHDDTPWLFAHDKEFANPDEVTPANILEGVFACEAPEGDVAFPGDSGRNISNAPDWSEYFGLSKQVSYTTTYEAGTAGDATITYTVSSENGSTRTRTVNMKVRSTERCRLDADIEYLTTPQASFLYMGRDYFDEQGKKAFDACVDALLHFTRDMENYPVIWKGEEVAQVTVPLQERGIYMKPSDAGYVTGQLLDDEPRMFHVKDWGAEVSKKGGMVDTLTFYVPKKFTVDGYYNKRLLAIEKNATTFLKKLEDGMTDAQRLRAVLYPYADWIEYRSDGVSQGQMLDGALADGEGVCGGNARGAIFLSQRMGIKAYWIRTDPHAWCNVKLNDGDGYYRVDLLARDGAFLSVDGGPRGYHAEIWAHRHRGWPTMVKQAYPFALTGWPAATIEVRPVATVIAPEDYGEFDIKSMVTSCRSIFDGDLSASLEVESDGGLAQSVGGGRYATGTYLVSFKATDSHGNTARATSYVRVGDDAADAGSDGAPVVDWGKFSKTSLKLWDGSAEVSYPTGWRGEDTQIAFDVADRGYAYFSAVIGLNRSSDWAIAYGEVQFEFYAEDAAGKSQLLYAGSRMRSTTKQERVTVSVPKDAAKIVVKVRGLSTAGGNHGGLAEARFIKDSDPIALYQPPLVEGVEDGQTYAGAVTPQIVGATKTTLYRKDLATEVNPDTGAPDEPVENAPRALRSDTGGVEAADADWGKEVYDYKPGQTVERNGRYTLVAVNGDSMPTTIRFTIDRSSGFADSDPEPTPEPEPGPDEPGNEGEGTGEQGQDDTGTGTGDDDGSDTDDGAGPGDGQDGDQQDPGDGSDDTVPPADEESPDAASGSPDASAKDAELAATGDPFASVAPFAAVAALLGGALIAVAVIRRRRK